jgi:hypothetical protein
MSVEEQLVNKILSAGTSGIKKTDLRREFGEIDASLEKAISEGDIFVDKRANAYYCFHRTHYIQSLLNSDPRFKLTYEMIRSTDESIKTANKDLINTIETLSNNISNLANLLLDRMREQRQSSSSSAPNNMLAASIPITGSQIRTMSIHDFKEKFDSALANSGSSIGWIELGNIRNKMCESYDISSEEFYRLVSELTVMYQDKYELSTGGGEGVIVRGLLHGFVRCI